MSQRTVRTVITAILALFILLGTVYSIVTPIFEASDEKWHYPMVKYIADHWALPVQAPGVETPWRQEGSQAPLYYAISAAATCWIDTSDMAEVRRLNPYVDAGATPDGNVNLVVHDPARERFPWRGTVLAVHVIRFLSVLMSAGAVYFTYRIARRVLPDHPALALVAAAIHAFTPMLLFISASVNNDNLAMLLSSLGLWLLVQIIGLQSPIPSLQSLVRRYLPLGIVLGLAALTKAQTLALAPLTALVVTVRAVRRRSWREFLVGGVATALPLGLIAGWWYARNLRLYGDLTGVDMFIQILGQRDVPADLAQLWRERFSFLAGYWGNFGGINVPMAAWVYAILNTLVPIAALGLIVGLIKARISSLSSHSPTVNRWPMIVCLLWGLLVFIPWLLWSRITWSSQGRLVFYAISVWSLLLTLGLASWLGLHWGRWIAAGFALFLLGLSIAAPFAWIAPAYALPEPLSENQISNIPHPVEVIFGDAMVLLGYDLETSLVSPGEQVAVTLYWRALAPTQQDYAVFVHLVGREGRLIAQRDTFPGLGLLSTTWIEPGATWADRYVIRVPATAYTPDRAQVAVGLYNAAGRLMIDGNADHVTFGQIDLRPNAGQVPNPIAVNFGDRMALVGYDLNALAARPGETITLTLYWRGLKEMAHNYSISAQLVNEELVKVAQDSNWPLGGDAPTMLWQPGNLLVDPKRLTIAPDAAPGNYDVRITVHGNPDGQTVNLPIISERGEMLSNHVLLTRVRVSP